MKSVAVCLVVVAGLVGCSNGRTQEDCDKIAADIRSAAVSSNIPTSGLCDNADNRERFGQACDELRECLDEVD